MNSALRVRLERLGPVRDMSRDRSYSKELVPIMLHRAGVLAHPVSVFRRLFDAGLSPGAAHGAVDDLAAFGRAACLIPLDADLDGLAVDLRAWNVHLLRRPSLPEPVE